MKKILVLMVLVPFFTSCKSSGNSNAVKAIMSLDFLMDAVFQTDESILDEIENLIEPSSIRKVKNKNLALKVLKKANLVLKTKHLKTNELNTFAFNNQSCATFEVNNLKLNFKNCTYNISDSIIYDADDIEDIKNECNITATTQTIDGHISAKGTNDKEIKIKSSLNFKGFFKANCKTDIRINIEGLEYDLDLEDDEQPIDLDNNDLLNRISGKICGVSFQDMFDAEDDFDSLTADEKKETICNAMK